MLDLSPSSRLRHLIPTSIKEGAKQFLETPLCAPIRQWYRGLGSVLMYHQLTDFEDFSLSWDTKEHFVPHLGLSVNRKRFEEQMAYVAKECHPIALPRIPEILKRSQSLDKPYVAVTFDDGYRDNLDIALPIAEKYEVPITVFITTGFISRTIGPWWYLLEECIRRSEEISFGGELFSCHSIPDKQSTYTTLMRAFRNATSEEQERYLRELDALGTQEFNDNLLLNWDEVRKLASHPLVTIGAHTERHPVLSQESRQTVRLEVLHSRKVLAEELGEKIDYFAYPFGDSQACAQREAEVLDELEVAAAFTTRSGHLLSRHLDHMVMIPRITIDYFDTLSRFRRKLSGVESISSDPLTRFVTL